MDTATVRPTPRSVRLARMRDLTSLIHRASAELATLAAHEAKAQAVELARPTEPDVKPSAMAAPVIRAWARDNGHPVGDRGAIPHDLRIAYAQAMETHR